MGKTFILGHKKRTQSAKNVRKCVRNFCNSLIISIYCGERGIRTPGASQHDGFQDRCNRPLYHLSSVRCLKSECKGSTKNEE